MPKMTRSHYNLIADATNEILTKLGEFMDGPTFEAFRLEASNKMATALAGTNSQFKFDRFRQRCLGIRRGR